MSFLPIEKKAKSAQVEARGIFAEPRLRVSNVRYAGDDSMWLGTTAQVVNYCCCVVGVAEGCEKKKFNMWVAILIPAMNYYFIIIFMWRENTCIVQKKLGFTWSILPLITFFSLVFSGNFSLFFFFLLVFSGYSLSDAHASSKILLLPLGKLLS